MIKWNANFNIPDCSVQVAIALVIIEEFKNVDDKCEMKIKITDEDQVQIIKEYEKIVEGIYESDSELYLILLNDFDNAEIV